MSCEKVIKYVDKENICDIMKITYGYASLKKGVKI